MQRRTSAGRSPHDAGQAECSGAYPDAVVVRKTDCSLPNKAVQQQVLSYRVQQKISCCILAEVW